MAHLTAGDAADLDRAQLILVIGFALAVVFVALAVLLNSVIFTENLATRSESARSSHALAVTNDVAAGTESIVAYANEHNTSDYASLETELRSGLGEMEHLAGRQQLATGGVINVTYLSYDRGTWIDQSYSAENFTTGDGGSDWQLASGAAGARSFRIHVTDPDELANTAPDMGGATMENFTVTASGPSNTWTMEVYHDRAGKVDAVSGSAYVAEIVDGKGNRRYCSVSDTVATFWINASAGTFAGRECSGLEFGENVSTVRSVSYDNGHNAYGTYRLMLEVDETTVDQTPYNSTGQPPPVTRPAIFDATVHVEFETPHVRFETDRHVVPEADDA